MDTITLTKKHTRQFKEALSLKADTTQATYIIFINLLLNYTGPELSRDKVISFLSTLSKNSILTAYYAIRFFYKSIGIPFDIKRSDIAPSGIKRIREVLTHDEVVKLIKGCDEFDALEAGYIALATTYGLRRGEIYNIKAEMIDIDNKILYISRLKAEEITGRDHLIPDEISHVLLNMKDALKHGEKPRYITNINNLFNIMCDKVGIILRPRLGLHSLRRALISELMTSGLSPTVVRDFIGWKPKERDILLDYTILNWKEVDSKVFSVHPYLKYWAL